jgi:hypothetical protein
VVTFPVLKEINLKELNILKLWINHSHELGKIPELIAMVAKSALNYITLTGEKVTTGCREQSFRSEEESTTSSGNFLFGESLLTPSCKASNILEFIAVASSPPRIKNHQTSGSEWDNTSQRSGLEWDDASHRSGLE